MYGLLRIVALTCSADIGCWGDAGCSGGTGCSAGTGGGSLSFTRES
jgi:hypothetical protein